MKLTIHVAKTNQKIIKACYDNLGSTETAKMLDRIKEMGYKYSTKACITACLFDVKTTPKREEIIEKANQASILVEKQYKRGLITNYEKAEKLTDAWNTAMGEMEKAVMAEFEPTNPLK